jgi:hypothetical protein
VAIAIIAAIYEFVAVRSKRLPTITDLVKSLPFGPPASPSSASWSWRSSTTSAPVRPLTDGGVATEIV